MQYTHTANAVAPEGDSVSSSAPADRRGEALGMLCLLARLHHIAAEPATLAH